MFVHAPLSDVYIIADLDAWWESRGTAAGGAYVPQFGMYAEHL
jgi:hypothetical protein